MIKNISNATRQNWKKLGTDPSKKRLCARANKTQSTRLVMPEESISQRNNTSLLHKIAEYIQTNNIPAHKAIFSLATNMLRKKASNSEGKNFFIDKYSYTGADNYLIHLDLPEDEEDILGVIYQAISPEGIRNQKGQYYTPRHIARQVLQDSPEWHDGYVLDPCCGSGSFLCEARVAHPSQLLGVDIDPIAVMITMANLMLRHPKVNFIPRIICGDFLQCDLFSDIRTKLAPYTNKIVAICTNPPWGASNNKEEEIFSQFLRDSINLLPTEGSIYFLLPESFGKIKTHCDIRKHLLNNTILHNVTYLPPIFSGVVTPCLAIVAKKGNNHDNDVNFFQNNTSITIKQQTILDEASAMLIARDETKTEIISIVKERGFYSLKESIWALGIVTGDNKGKISAECKGKEWLPLCTGKDISPYKLKAPSKYVRYVRSELQQVAKEEIYNSPEKLVYKFISDTLCFAYDNSGVRFLNSANILIPAIPNMTIKTVLGFLNSDLFRFVYSSLFTDIKILKGNLCMLPFPEITPKDDEYISKKVEAILGGETKQHSILQEYIFNLYKLSNKQINYIKNAVYGNN